MSLTSAVIQGTGTGQGSGQDSGQGSGERTRTRTGRLALAALGVVFGDIGTSPLYALRECINGEHAVTATHDNVLGVLSLIVWSLTLVVTVKYLSFILRADNQGEGGILALLALVPEEIREPRNGQKLGWVTLLVLAGAALLYGDGMITPSISVLSAVEGLDVAGSHVSRTGILGITVAILVGLFALQKRGTSGIGSLFGPVMVVWFTAIGALGVWHLAQNPEVLAAIDPRHAIRFFGEHGIRGFIVLGSVVLAVTGGEALYADMGHFGRLPIRIAWLGLVFPSLLLAYFGMGARVLAYPAAARNPFFGMVPEGAATYAMVGLATCATIIASQALISGAYSLTHQAVQLGYFPRVLVRHTSRETEGQIYVPAINWLLAAACVILVVAFRESSRLAAAYGIAVTGTMVITSIVFYVVTRRTWGWPVMRSLPLALFFLTFDLAFFSANLTKLRDGGWVPVAVGAAFLAVMVVWRRGRRRLAEILRERKKPVSEFIAAIHSNELPLQCRIKGTAVVMAALADGVPPMLVHLAERTQVLHEQIVILTIRTAHVPFTDPATRARVIELGEGFRRVIATFGFMEKPNVPALLRHLTADGALAIDLKTATYFLGRETILALPSGRMGRTEESLFAVLARNSRQAAQHFDLPPAQVVEIGVQVDL